METQIKAFISLYMAYRRNQTKLEQVRSAKPNPKNAVKAVTLVADITGQRTSLDQQALAISTELKAKEPRKPSKKRAPVLPLFQAINSYFVEIFQQYKQLDELYIADAETFQCDLQARFRTEYPIADIEKKLDADGEVTPKGYLFKRADFFVPNAEVEVAS